MLIIFIWGNTRTLHQIRPLRHYSEGSFYGYQVNAEKVQENMLGWRCKSARHRVPGMP